jgi:hypothetical protein
MELPLPDCETFRRIPPEFFSPEYDQSSFLSGPSIPLVPTPQFRKCAQSACSFCSIIRNKSQMSWVPDKVLELTPLILRRAIIGPERGFCLCIGSNDVSFTVFHRFPDSWRTSKVRIATAVNSSIQAMSNCPGWILWPVS